MSKIRVGLDEWEKQKVIANYIIQHGIKSIYVFFPKQFILNIPRSSDVSIEYVEYADIIMYKTFYPLLEKIDESSLLVFNECMRTQNRSDLTYNCAHHYCNQTPHKLVFEFFPFIEDESDSMILLDLLNKGKYKGRSFDSSFLHEEDVAAKQHWFTLDVLDIAADGDLFGNQGILQEYEEKKESLFDNLGMSDPDTIPRQLHVFVGKWKKKNIMAHFNYVARNSRFGMPNVTTYKKAGNGKYIILDFPHRRIDFNDFLKVSSMTDIQFISSGMKVDLYYINEFKAWIQRLEEFYVKASIYE